MGEQQSRSAEAGGVLASPGGVLADSPRAAGAVTTTVTLLVTARTATTTAQAIDQGIQTRASHHGGQADLPIQTWSLEHHPHPGHPGPL